MCPAASGAGGLVVVVGRDPSFGQLPAEGAETAHGVRRWPAGGPAQSLLDHLVGLGVHAAAAAGLEVPGDLVGPEIIEFPVEVTLQDVACLPTAQLLPPPPAPRHRCSSPPRIPAASSVARIRTRARCSRLITVPTGTPRVTAASW